MAAPKVTFKITLTSDPKLPFKVDWLIDSGDKRLAVQKALQWANFIEKMHAKLEAEDKLGEFARRYGRWRQPLTLPPLQYAGFKSACDELTKSILLKHLDHQDIIKIALEEYLNQCGEERTLSFLRVLSAESLLIKLLAIFLCNENHYDGGAPTLSRLSKAIWYEMFLKLLPEEVERGEADWNSTVDKLIVSKTGVETLVFFTIMKNQHLETLQKIIISRFNQNLVVEEGDVERYQFWQNFIGCDCVLLCIMFGAHAEFFEEFLEFFIKAGADLKKTINENGDEEWAPSNWLKYEDVLKVAKMMITCDLESVSSYTTQVILSSKDEHPLWEEIGIELGNLMNVS